MEAANCFSQHVHTTDMYQSGRSNAVLLSRPQLKETRPSSEFRMNLRISPGKITELNALRTKGASTIAGTKINVLTEELRTVKEASLGL